jgi:hypothetical protein
MENKGIEIQTVHFESKDIVINYVNGATETLPVNINTYKQFHDAWLVKNPPFISDLYKTQMRNIILACINNNQKCIANLDTFFASPNEEVVKKFLTYMRNRDTILPVKKAVWNNA